MRTLTNKENEALSIAFQTFMRELDGKRRNLTTVMPIVEKAFDAGLTIDEIFNPYNYVRAKEFLNELSPADYINILIDMSIPVRDIKDEPDWCDNLDNMTLIAKCFHDFYMAISPKGGTWNTDNARMNLEKAIRRNSLQTIMSEDLIIQVALKEQETLRKKTGDTETDPDKEQAVLNLTCFNYILSLLKNAEDFNIQCQLTEGQINRKNYLANLAEEAAAEAAESSLPEQEIAEEEIEETVERNEAEKGNPVITETASDKDDGDIYPESPSISLTSEESLAKQNGQPEHEEYMAPNTDVFISYNSPHEYKKNCIRLIIQDLSLEELDKFRMHLPDTRTLGDFIDKLTDCELETDNEDPQLRNLHQILNGELQANFISCVRLQGFDMNEEMAAQHDIINENWDFRDEKTRKLYKLRSLILKYGENDTDLLNIITELEDLYQENDKNNGTLSI